MCGFGGSCGTAVKPNLNPALVLEGVPPSPAIAGTSPASGGRRTWMSGVAGATGRRKGYGAGFVFLWALCEQIGADGVGEQIGEVGFG